MAVVNDTWGSGEGSILRIIDPHEQIITALLEDVLHDVAIFRTITMFQRDQTGAIENKVKLFSVLENEHIDFIHLDLASGVKRAVVRKRRRKT